MWQAVVVLILCIAVYNLWVKVNALTKHIKDNEELGKELTKFGISPLPGFYDIPLIREAIGIDVEKNKLNDADIKRLHEWTKKEQRTLYQTYTFFPDREILFSLTEGGGGFINFPNRTENLFYKEIGKTKDDYEISFNIAVRWLKDLPEFPKQNVPVYVCYLKKSKFGGKREELFTIFELPHAFINPVFFGTEVGEEIIKKLENHFKLEPKNDEGSFGEYTNEFGEQAWFREGHWHENNYYKIYYP